MKITAITKYKHGELYAILQRIGWTQSELARQTDMHASEIGLIINLVRRPTAKQADAIQKAIGTAGEYLDVLAEWPEAFEGLKRGYKREQTAEVELENLIGNREAMMLPAPDTEDTSELDNALQNVLNQLPNRERSIIKERFWNGKKYSDIAKCYGLSSLRISQIEAMALRRLSHPERTKKLAPLRVNL
jgi:RNA polymerase sigma factor (sigma-70 family)